MTQSGSIKEERRLICRKVDSEQISYQAETAWRAAQVEAKDLLGKNGSTAVMEIASRIMDA